MMMMIAISVPQSEYVHLMNLSGVKCAFMRWFICICMHINERRGRRRTSVCRTRRCWLTTKKGPSSVRHSGPTVMMNADWIYRGGKWVWIREKLDKWRREGDNKGGGGRGGRNEWKFDIMNSGWQRGWRGLEVHWGSVFISLNTDICYWEIVCFGGLGSVCDGVCAKGTHTKVERGCCHKTH